LLPAVGETGTATITITAVSEVGKQAVLSFEVTVTEPDVPLSFTVPQTLTTRENNATAPQTIEISASPSQIKAVELSADSLNPTLIPSENVLFAGTGTSRQMVIAPQPDQHGQARLIIRATLGDISVSREIDVIVAPSNTPPTVRGFPFEIRLLSGQRRVFQFVVEDAEEDQVITFLLTNPPEFAPLVQLARTGNLLTVTVEPGAAQTGTFEITIVAEDAQGLFATATCVVTIIPPSIALERDGDELVVRWSELDGVSLQFASDLLGEWQPVAVLPSAVSPARGEGRLRLDRAVGSQYFRINID
jgi:hypothetical protein